MELFVRSKERNSVSKLTIQDGARVVLGRSLESPVALDGPAISREHVALEARGGALYAADLSANGSWISGRPMARGDWQAVAVEDLIELPGYEIGIEAPAAAAEVAEAGSPAGKGVPALAAGDLRRAFRGRLSGVEKTSLVLFMFAVAIATAYFLSL